MFSQYSQTLLILLCILLHQSVVQAQHLNNTAIWCTVSEAEQRKCEAFARAVDREIAFFGYTYISLQCRRAFNKEECMAKIDQEQAQLTTLDAGEVFLGGRYHSLVPITQEIYNSGVSYQYAVAVLKKGTLTDVQTLHDLRGKKACFAGVGTLAGWILPIYTLIKQGGMEIIDCNNHVKSAITYFGPSCAVNSLIDKYNPLGDNSDQLCKLCIGKIPGERCTIADPYAGYEGALRCLNNVGEIAFVVHTTVEEMTSLSTLDFAPTPELHNKSSTNPSVIRKEKFELLCRDGSRRPIDEYRSCNWGTVPSRALVTSSATELKTRRLYQKFLDKAIHIFNRNPLKNNPADMYNNRSDNGRQQDNFENRSGNNRFGENGYNKGINDEYGSETSENRDNYERSYEDGNNDLSSWNSNPSRNSTSYWYRDRDQDGSTDIPSIQPIEVFNLFESVPKYGVHHNLMFSDVAKDFYQIPEKDQTYTGYLGRSLDSILGVRDCPVDRMTLCVTSDPEMEKCIKMKIALKAQLLKPELVCHKGHSQINCMEVIRSGTADVTVLDASDVYTAGLRYHLIPFISEVYNLGTPDYYVVAVAKEEDDNTDLTYLKNKNTCHPGINTAAGWIIPMAYLINNFWIRGYGCDSVRAAAEYFSKSCIPGALSTEYNTGVPYDNMCGLCHGVSYRHCRRDASEDYFGYTGAFRCLVEGGGDVAFVKHTTVAENASGKRREFWARNTFIKDFELLCPDGTRKKTTEYESCNLGKASANAVVTRGGEAYNETQLAAYINLFVYMQQFYGRKEQDDFSFSMFYSNPPYSDLIFQDATQQLMIIPPEKREFSAYLGPDFMRARRIVDCKAAASTNKYSLFSTAAIILFILVLNS